MDQDSGAPLADGAGRRCCGGCRRCASPLQARYGRSVDRESAYELLTGRLAGSAGSTAGNATTSAAPAGHPLPDDGLPPVTGVEIPMPLPYNPYDDSPSITGTAPEKRSRRRAESEPESGGILGGMLESQVVTSFMRSLGTSLGGALGRSISGTRRRRR